MERAEGGGKAWTQDQSNTQSKKAAELLTQVMKNCMKLHIKFKFICHSRKKRAIVCMVLYTKRSDSVLHTSERVKVSTGVRNKTKRRF